MQFKEKAGTENNYQTPQNNLKSQFTFSAISKQRTQQSFIVIFISCKNDCSGETFTPVKRW